MGAFDFIVVGSGPSAATVAKRLSSSSARPSVLHLKAESSSLQHDADVAVDSYPWISPLISTPQEHIGGRTFSLTAGHALGGASTLEAYHSAWAEKVGDTSYGLTRKGSPSNNITYGSLASSYGPLTPESLGKETSNLTVDVLSQPDRILFDGSKVVGISTNTGTVLASKEVILCAGALRTPHLLLLSGIGPKDHLSSFNIPLIRDLPVGEAMKDSLMIPIVWEVGSSFSESADWLFDPETMRAHLRQFLNLETNLSKDYPSLLSVVSGQSGAVLDSHDLQALPVDAQTFVSHPTTSHWEICPLPTSGTLETARRFLQINAFPQVVSSTGTLKLASADATEPPLVSPGYLSEPIDRQSAIEAVRIASRFFEVLESLSNDVIGPKSMPAGNDDESVLDFIRQTATTARHYSCTLPMGKFGESQACVDSDFRVFGVQGLRVADLSVTPLLPASHPQATPHVLGSILVDKLAHQYDLNI
ncbi:hypothetical protein ACHAQA_006879 [Verticillium albo-atrum]